MSIIQKNCYSKILQNQYSTKVFTFIYLLTNYVNYLIDNFLFLSETNCISNNCQDKNIIYRSSRPEVFCRKGVLRNIAKFAGKHPCRSLFFNKAAGLLKKRLRHWCFLVNFAKFLRTPFLTKNLRWLLLNLYWK